MAKQYSDSEIQVLLNKLRDKRRRYLNRRGYEAKAMEDIFAQTGLFNEKNGKIVSVEEFKKKMGFHINYGIAMIEEKLDKGYIMKITKQLKDNLVVMLNNMGLEEESKKVAKMGYRKFVMLEESGEWDYVVEKYDDYDTTSLAETISGEKSVGNKLEAIKDETRKYLGWL